MTDNPDRFRLTDEDVDYVGAALVDSLEPIAERARNGDGRNAGRPYICQVNGCTRPRLWAAKIEVAHPAHGTPIDFDVEICGDHRDEFRLEHFRNRLRWVGYPVRKMTARRLSA